VFEEDWTRPFTESRSAKNGESDSMRVPGQSAARHRWRAGLTFLRPHGHSNDRSAIVNWQQSMG
jgi:hypothetical protein